MEIGSTLYTTKRAQWRAWLKKHHRREREIWLIFPNKASGKPRLAYGDAVEEALCFGWIDSTVKKLDQDSVAQRYTPRKPRSSWSEPNKERLRRMIKAGKVAPAGFAAASGIDLKSPKRKSHVKIAPDILKNLQADSDTWRNFQRFPVRYQHIRISWIEAARGRPQFEQRLNYFLKMTRQNRRYGVMG